MLTNIKTRIIALTQRVWEWRHHPVTFTAGEIVVTGAAFVVTVLVARAV